jgi:AmpD protein
VNKDIDIKNGLVSQARQVNSPNFDERPASIEIDLIVIHNISLPPGQFGGPWIDALFTNTLDSTQDPFFKEIVSHKVSAHILIRRDGEIVQYVPFHYRAWHAGESEYEGRKNCNDFSIGIEMEGCDDHGFESIQYQKLANLIIGLLSQYVTISRDHITGHSDIAPDRKTDPGPYFDWQRLRDLLA